MKPRTQSTEQDISPTSQETMKTARLAGAEQFVVETTARPECEATQVLVRLQGCGLCASNLPPFEGRSWFDYPFEPGKPGHEGWGIVEEVGDEVDDVSVGDRVAALSYHAFADYDVAESDQVVVLPDALDDMAFPGEPLGCAMNIFERSDIESGQTVAVVGAGFLGCLLVGLAKDADARVIAVSRRSFSLEMARRFGADELVEMDDHERIIDEIMGLTGDEGCDRVIECTGKEWPLNLAGELTRIRGRLVVAGFHQGGMREVNIQLWNWRGLDVINAHERDPQRYIEGIERAVDACMSGRLDPTPLYTHRFDLDDIDEAFDVARRRPESFMKALIVPDGA